jgi:hypothetical protein
LAAALEGKKRFRMTVMYHNEDFLDQKNTFKKDPPWGASPKYLRSSFSLIFIKLLNVRLAGCKKRPFPSFCLGPPSILGLPPV